MTRGARASVFLGVFAVAIAVSAGSRIASAQASGPPQASDLVAGITAYANSEVNAAMAESAAVVSQVAQVELPVPPPASSLGGPAPPPPVEVTPPPSSTTGDPPTGPGPDPVVITAAVPLPTPPAPAAGVVTPAPIIVVPFPQAAGSPVREGVVARHHLGRLALRSKSTSRSSRTIVRGSTSSLRVELRTSTTVTALTSSSSTRAVAQSSVRSTVESSSTGSRSQKPAGPNAPLPSFPSTPNAPAPPNSGVSSTGGVGGQGALLTFSVALAAFVLFGIHRLLRRVHWSGLRMPGRGAALPWRPG
jgi:hypothetical protein